MKENKLFGFELILNASIAASLCENTLMYPDLQIEDAIADTKDEEIQ